MSLGEMPPSNVCELARIIGSGNDDCIERLEDILTLLEMLNELVIVTDTEGSVLYANKMAETTTGYRLNEIVGKKPSLWGRQMDAEYYQMLWQTIAVEKQPFQGDLRNKRKNGTTYDASLQIAPILDAKGDVRFFIAVERDITKTKQLERAQREFISLASHNLKTPLASMRWYSEMLLDGDVGKLSSSQREYVKEILEAAQRMVALIQQWLRMSRIDLGLYTFQNEALNVDELVNSVLEAQQERARGKHVSLNFHVGVMPSIMVADRDALQTIIHTLILNSVKYNREGGSVNVEVTVIPAHQEYGGRTFQDRRVALSVNDTGIGIPTEEQGRVFQQFFRGSNVERMQSQGAGLGLFLTRELVRMLSGDIWFSSSSEGTTFFVSLPTDSVVKETSE